MYSLNTKCVLRPEKDGAGLLSDSTNGTVYVLNPVAMNIATLLEKSPLSEKELIDRVKQAFRNPSQAVEQELRTFLQTMLDRGFVNEVDK